jgi:Flp pilus assembly protein TadD
VRRIPYEIVASVPWPSADFARGLKDILLFTEAGHPVYLLGRTSDAGWWWSPFVTLAVKMTLPLILLAAAAKLRVLARPSERRGDLLFILVPALLVLATNVAANLGIGVRHLLPMFPFAMMLAAWPLRFGWPAAPRWRLALLALLAWQVGGTVAMHPDYLPYFNEIARAAGGGEKILGDSNLDWGQDLSTAVARLKARGVSRAILGYFGTADPFVEGIEWQVLPPTQRPKSEDPWVVLPAQGAEWLLLSTTNRQGIYYRAPGGGRPYPWLEGVRPVEVVGHGTISLYEISTNADVQRGLADLYLRHGLEDEGVAALRRALAITPFDAVSRKRLVAIYHRRGELARADSTVLGGENPDVPLLLEWTMIRRELGDDARTRLAFEQCLKGFPNDPELKNAYAWFLQEIDDELDNALQLASDAVKWSPDDPAFLDTRGMVHLKRHETKEALEDFATALKLPGGDLAAIHWHRVLALAQSGRHADALEEARAVQQRDDLEESLRAEVETWLLPH